MFPPKLTKMPERQPHDGAVGIERVPEGLLISHDPEPGGDTNSRACDRLIVSEFNAVRLAAMLCVMLGIKIDKKQQEIIKL